MIIKTDVNLLSQYRSTGNTLNATLERIASMRTKSDSEAGLKIASALGDRVTLSSGATSSIDQSGAMSSGRTEFVNDSDEQVRRANEVAQSTQQALADTYSKIQKFLA